MKKGNRPLDVRHQNNVNSIQNKENKSQNTQVNSNLVSKMNKQDYGNTKQQIDSLKNKQNICKNPVMSSLRLGLILTWSHYCFLLYTMSCTIILINISSLRNISCIYLFLLILVFLIFLMYIMVDINTFYYNLLYISFNNIMYHRIYSYYLLYF